jgi:hypothetical protein
VGLGPEPKLREFLANLPNKDSCGDLAIDNHVLFPYSLVINQRGHGEGLSHPITIKYEMDDPKDPNAEKDGLEIIAAKLRIDLDTLLTMINDLGYEDYDKSRRRPDPNSLVYFVKKIDISHLDIDRGGVVDFSLGVVKFSTILALKNAMYHDEITIPGSNYSLHQHLQGLALIDDLNRTVFCAGIAIHLNVISKDGYVVLTHRSKNVETHPHTWGDSVDESMKGEKDKYGYPPDSDFQALGKRGIEEELGLSNEEVSKEEIQVIAFGGEYDDLEFAVHGVYESTLTFDQIKDRWRFRKKDTESDKVESKPFQIESVRDLIIERKPTFPYSPSSFNPNGPRMNLLLLLLRKFKLDEVTKAFNDYPG